LGSQGWEPPVPSSGSFPTAVPQFQRLAGLHRGLSSSFSVYRAQLPSSGSFPTAVPQFQRLAGLHRGLSSSFSVYRAQHKSPVTCYESPGRPRATCSLPDMPNDMHGSIVVVGAGLALPEERAQQAAPLQPRVYSSAFPGQACACVAFCDSCCSSPSYRATPCSLMAYVFRSE